MTCSLGKPFKISVTSSIFPKFKLQVQKDLVLVSGMLFGICLTLNVKDIDDTAYDAENTLCR
jgi:hypothetical protein